MKNLLLVAMSFAFPACGSYGSKGSTHAEPLAVQAEKATIKPDTSDTTVQERYKISIPISISSDQLSLATTATAFSISLSGCISGTTESATESTPTFKIFKNDTGCLAKMNSLTVNGKSYSSSNPSAVPFSSFVVNSTAIFTDSSGTNKINVAVSNQISTPVAPTDIVRYTFSIIRAGDSSVVSNDSVSEGHSAAVEGDLPPNYKIDKINFQGLNASGFGRFTFQFECQELMAGAAAKCSGLALSETSYALVQDIYSGAPSAQQLMDLFSGSSALASQSVSNTTNGLGGFLTDTLDGPGQLAFNPKMILVLKNGNSFLYFLISTQAL